MSDGTAAGTVMVANIFSGGSSAPSSLTLCGERVFFVADTPYNGTELWALRFPIHAYVPLVIRQW